MKKYQPKDIEQTCQKKWHERNFYNVTKQNNKPKYYCLSMYPYPSGTLHMGHVRNYALSDIDARFHRLLGYNVLHPIGWDSFGLPAENAAMIHNISPKEWTDKNIIAMKERLKALGFSFAWDREIKSHDPNYYSWEQTFFLRLLKDNLAYQKERFVYWCPNDETVLANEQVDQGKCWRCGLEVETRSLKQWFLRITDFAEELLNGLDDLPDWPSEVKVMQRNWIGKKTGYSVDFKLCESKESILSEQVLPCFVEHLELIYSASHVAVTIEHPLVLTVMRNNPIWKKRIEDFLQSEGLQEARQSCAKKDLGLMLPLSVKHPFTEQHLPIVLVTLPLTGEKNLPWVGLAPYSTIDFRIAQQLNCSPIDVISTSEKNSNENSRKYLQNTTDFLKNSGEFSGILAHQAIPLMKHALERSGVKCESTNVYRLKDWGISRQRYWGAPIPILIDKEGRAVPEFEGQLPVHLPEFQSFSHKKNILEGDETWNTVTREGQTYHRLCETFDTFIQSSWYYTRYCSRPDSSKMVDSEKANYWLPVDHYIGGIEHATMHLMYFRFFHKLFKHYGMLESKEPATRLTCQGMVLSDAFYQEIPNAPKRWLSPSEVSITRNVDGEIVSALDSENRSVIYAGCCKMSKSKNNGVAPEEMIDRYGADATRFFVLFAAPPQMHLHWSEQGVVGASRFLKRLWALGSVLLGMTDSISTIDARSKKALSHFINQRNICIDKVTKAYGPRFTINVGIAAVMEFFNTFSKFVEEWPIFKKEEIESFKIILKLLHPVVPHITEVLWAEFSKDDLTESGWPVIEAQMLQDIKTLVIQLNGKKIATLECSPVLEKEEALRLVLANSTIKEKIGDITQSTIIYIPGKILNIARKQVK